VHNPLLINVDKNLNGIHTRIRGSKTTVIAYADDITTIVTEPEEIGTMKEILQDYEHATGARINPKINYMLLPLDPGINRHP